MKNATLDLHENQEGSEASIRKMESVPWKIRGEELEIFLFYEDVSLSHLQN